MSVKHSAKKPARDSGFVGGGSEERVEAPAPPELGAVGGEEVPAAGNPPLVVPGAVGGQQIQAPVLPPLQFIREEPGDTNEPQRPEEPPRGRQGPEAAEQQPRRDPPRPQVGAGRGRGNPPPPGPPGPPPPGPPGPPPGPPGPPGPAGGPAAMAHNEITGSHLATIPLFNGEESIGSVNNFIASVDRAIQQFNWDPARAGVAAQSRLIDKAQTWLRGQKILGKELDDWEDVAAVVGPPAVAARTGLKTLIRKRFGKVITSALAVDAVQDLKQKEGESVARFFDRVALALDRKNYIYTDQQKQAPAYRDALNHDLNTFFLGGLLPGIRRRVLGVANPPNNPDDSFDAARAAEAEENKNKRALPVAAIGQAGDEGEYIEDDVTGEVMAVQGAGRGTSFTCHKCGGLNHYARDCPTKPGQGVQRQGGRGQYRGRGNSRGRGRGWQNRGGRQGNRKQVNAVEKEADRPQEQDRTNEKEQPPAYENQWEEMDPSLN